MEGEPFSSRSAFCCSSSLSIISSPTLAFSRAISSSRSSAGRLFSAARPPSRN
jgi:hypothetical protein